MLYLLQRREFMSKCTNILSIHQHCIVSGKSPRACYGAIIKAQYSTLFELNDCSTGDDTTCQAMSIYVPQTILVINVQYYILETISNLIYPFMRYLVGKILISLIHQQLTVQGVMYCSYGYYETCDISQNEWSCKDKNSFCINPLNRYFLLYIKFLIN